MPSTTSTQPDRPDVIGEKPVILEPQPHGGALLRSGGPGRPKVRKDLERQVREALFEGSEEAPSILDVLITKARKGDMRAIETALHYGVGKPTDRVEVSGPEGGPITHSVLNDDELRLLRDVIAEVEAEGHSEDVAEGGAASA